MRRFRLFAAAAIKTGTSLGYYMGEQMGDELFIDHGDDFLQEPACESPCRHMCCADARRGRFDVEV